MNSARSSACFFFGLLALLGSTMTQFRIQGVGLGPAEASGLIAVALYLTQVREPSVVARVIPILGTIFLGLAVGIIANFTLDLPSSVVLRDLIAFVFASLLAFVVISECVRLPNHFYLLLSGLDVLVLSHLIPLLLVPLGIEMNAWLGDTQGETVFAPGESRYVGFSVNPHQLGMFLCFYFPLALTPRGTSFLAQALRLAGLSGAALLGYLTFSYTLLLAVVSAVVAYLIGLLIRAWKPRTVLAALFVFLGAIGLAASVVLPTITQVRDTLLNKTQDGDASGRIPRWHNGVRVVVASYGFGAGPGAHSGETRPFEGEEAHNTFIDIAQQGGLLSLAGFATLWTLALVNAVRSRSPIALAVAAAVLVEQLAHYTLRHPIGWLPLFLLLFWRQLPVAIQERLRWQRTVLPRRQDRPQAQSHFHAS